MATKTFTNPGGGSWETPANWTQPGIPSPGDDVLINDAVTGTYGVTITAVESPLSVTLNDTTATLLVSSTGQLLGTPLTLDAGTFTLDGILLDGTVINSGGTFDPFGGTLDGVTWQGPLAGPAGATAGPTINIKDGITLLNTAGNGPGTIDLDSLYMVNIVDSTPLDNMVINFGTTNNEYLNGSQSAALIVDSNVTLNQSGADASGFVTGATLISGGTINASGSGAVLFVSSTEFDNSGIITVSGGDHMTINDGFSNAGAVDVASSGKLTLSSTSANTLTNTSTIAVSTAGSLVVSGSLSGDGLITMSSFGVADMFNTTANIVAFLDGKGTLRLENPGTFNANIAGFLKGDKIDLVATNVTNIIPTFLPTSTVLTIENGASTVATLNLLGDYSKGFTFGKTTDGAGGFNITVACFAEGTRIRTATGEVPVESLREGDLLPVRIRRGVQPITWIGHRQVDCRRHPRPQDVWPVRIAAGAFGLGLPRTSLLLSPDHAVYFDGLLIPVKYLINGSTIVQQMVDCVTYYHVKLAHHDVLLAEGLSAETYLDSGDRSAFANGGEPVALHPDFSSRVWDAQGCAPMVITGPRLDAVRQWLNLLAETSALARYAA